MMIATPVGPRRPNRTADVRTIQSLLNRARSRVPGLVVLREDGICGPRTAAAISHYQTQVLRFGKPDGVIDPGGPTLTALSRAPTGGRPAAPAPVLRPVSGSGPTPAPRSAADGRAGPGGISEATYVDIAARLECETAAVKALVETEVAIRGPYDSAGRPTILFERHKFHAHTNGRFAAAHPDICNATPGGYGRDSEQYPKLERAMALNRAAALKSASWGAFQILGENHVQARHSTVEAFVDAMKKSLLLQVEAFLAFVRADRRLLSAIRSRNWPEFARIYNGPSYKKYKYDEKMRTNYQKYAAQ
ncbi:MAG: N-acetylmuramidase family protein [Sphingomonas paucimobilis]